MAYDLDERLPDRLNAEPAIFKGCSTTELGLIALGATLLWLPLSLLITLLLGVFTMGFGLAGVGVVATVVAGAGVFQRVKRGRPDGYYQIRAMIWLSQKGLCTCPYVLRSGTWDLGRTNSESL